MFDLAYNPTDALALAQATTPPALVAPQPNWTSNNPSMLKALRDVIETSERYTTPSHTYTEKGPLGMPALVWNIPIKNILVGDESSQRRPMAQILGLASTSCFILDADARQVGAWGPECKIAKFITMPKGKLSPSTWKEAGEGDFMYTPRRAGTYTDTAHFILENGAGKKVDVTVKIKINKWTPEGGAIEADTKFAELEQNDESAAWLLSNALDGNGADLNGVTYSFSNLAGAALAQTTGQSITLDTNAAGHGWFVDSTPGDNSEFLPTADANIWKAKEGSDAAGKIDMLSVLLHEYGHVLGIEHSADQHASMAATLQPGTRRLPTADELALMAQLVSKIKVGMNSDLQGGQDNAPLDPLGGFGGGFAALLLGTRFGSLTTAFDSVQVSTPVSQRAQYQVTANPTLTYKLSDSRVDSNIATVSISVTAVNDAPVTAKIKRGLPLRFQT